MAEKNQSNTKEIGGKKPEPMEPVALARVYIIHPTLESPAWMPSTGLKITPPCPSYLNELIQEFFVGENDVVSHLQFKLLEHCNLGDQILPYLSHAYMMLVLVASQSDFDPDVLLHQFILPLKANRAQVLQELTIRISLCCLGGISWKDLNTWGKCWVAVETALMSLGVPLKKEALSGGVPFIRPPVIVSEQQNEETPVKNECPNKPDSSDLCSNQEENREGDGMAEHQEHCYGLDQSPSGYLDEIEEKFLKKQFGFDLKRCPEDPHRFITDSRGASPEERDGGFCGDTPLESTSEYSVRYEAYTYLDNIVLKKQFYLHVD